jgi:hypothetical protein
MSCIMKKLMLLILVVCVSASVLSAAVQCTTLSGGTLQGLITAGSCDSQDKTFSNFTYTGSLAANLINVTLIFDQIGSTTDEHGWNFAPIAVTWNSGFTLGYTISVLAGNPGVLIFQSKDQINTGSIPNSIVVTDTQTVGTMTMNGAAVGNETKEITYPGVVSINTSTVAVIPAGNGMQSYEQDWFENTAAPEPVSLLLVGAGLLGLGFVQRRRRKV